MSDDSFRCAICGGVFIKGRTDEEALTEMRGNFGDLPETERGVICDDCYPEFMVWFRKQPHV
jgi:hypothetical protein